MTDSDTDFFGRKKPVARAKTWSMVMSLFGGSLLSLIAMFILAPIAWVREVPFSLLFLMFGCFLLVEPLTRRTVGITAREGLRDADDVIEAKLLTRRAQQ